MSRRSVVTLLLLLAAPFSACDCGAEPLAETRPSIAVPALLDFGAIGEGTSVTQALVVENLGAGELELTAVMGEGSATDFTLDNAAAAIAPQDTGTLNVRYSPTGVGEDGGDVVITSNDERNPEVHVLLHGGPIVPLLTAPDEVDFAPADASIVARTLVLTNDGLAILHIETIAVDAGASPQFSTTAPNDVELLPAESITVSVEHARSTRTDEGRLLVRSDDPADAAGGGVRVIRLLPDPLGECEDAADNDGDLLADYPEDPGCVDRFDDSEGNNGGCVDGATQVCGTDVGACVSGLRTCVGGVFGDCDGETVATTETCNTVDDDCNGTVDDNDICGAGSCDPDGSYALFTPISYACCFGIVSQSITSFVVANNGAVATGSPSGFGMNGSAQCPTGAIDVTNSIAGGCTETYTLTGTFTNANTFVGTYDMTFTGAQCTTSLCGADPCISQTFNVTGTRP